MDKLAWRAKVSTGRRSVEAAMAATESERQQAAIMARMIRLGIDFPLVTLSCGRSMPIDSPAHGAADPTESSEVRGIVVNA
ncbi:hypothetical protein [Dyella sp. A6]|uniref:hypothetical protein n=1 Tax=Dyella aluminiiresistens TaxID=3069105 RepID=UPI002E763E35|nr:hypothetical protein [Dyella sp. A6]